jgi:hypothetical protein
MAPSQPCVAIASRARMSASTGRSSTRAPRSRKRVITLRTFRATSDWSVGSSSTDESTTNRICSSGVAHASRLMLLHPRRKVFF